MSKGRVILSRNANAIFIASEEQQGKWNVEATFAERKVTCLAADPSHPGVVYAGTREEGVWRTSDFGKTWTQLGLNKQIVTSLSVDPHSPGTLYAGSKPALIFRSTDGGESWHELESFRRIPNRWWWFSPADPPDKRPYVIEISHSPSDPGVMLAGVELGGVFRSEDGGETWSRHRQGAIRDCHSLKFHAKDGQVAYQAGGGLGSGMSISRDGGQTWKKSLWKGLSRSYGIACAADGEDPRIWYGCVGPSPWKTSGESPEVYLYRSNGNREWDPIGWTDHPLNETPTVMVSIPGSSGELYVGTHKGSVWYTTDHGEQWSRLPIEMDAIWHSLVVLSR